MRDCRDKREEEEEEEEENGEIRGEREGLAPDEQAQMPRWD